MAARASMLLLAVVSGLSGGCAGPDLPPLPAHPEGRVQGVLPPPPPPEDVPPRAPDPPPGTAPAPTDSVPPPPDGAGAPVATVRGGAPAAARDGEPLLPGVLLRGPALAGGGAEFHVSNGAGVELPDLILTVQFVLGGEGPEEDRTWLETVEAPLAAGETRAFRVVPSRVDGGAPVRFRVDAGSPEILAVAEGGGRGTTFLGGRMECVELEMDLTAAEPFASVGLAPTRGASAASLGSLEAQLLLSRAGRLVWAGPWIRIPEAVRGEDAVRRLRWNLRSAGGTAGTTPYLRVRERQ